MALEAEDGVVRGHPAAVVHDTDKSPSGICHNDRHLVGIGVKRVLQEFLHHRGRPLDHLARGYHICNVLRKYP